MTTGSFTPKKLFSELRWEIGKALFLKEFLNAAILFFSINIILALLNLSFIFSLIVALVFLIIRMFQGFRKSTVLRIEKGNPEVAEILRTAYDHQHTNSLMVQGLMFDLQKKLSTVSTGVLISPKRTIGKLFLIALLVFIPLILVSVAPFIIADNPLARAEGPLFDWFAGQSVSSFSLSGIRGVNLSEDDIRFGSEQLVRLGDDELTLLIQEGGNILDLTQQQEASQRTFRQGVYSGGIDIIDADFDRGARVFSEEEILLINEFSCAARGECE